jgi:hypothetical protein
VGAPRAHPYARPSDSNPAPCPRFPHVCTALPSLFARRVT